MASFVWNIFRLTRLRSVVRSYNSAITKKARELEKAGLSELTNYLPAKTSVTEIQSRINNVNDFRRIVGYKSDIKRGRTSELTRILKSVNPNALDIVINEQGATTTNYAIKERKLNKIAINKQRRKTVEDLARPFYAGDDIIDLSTMSEPDYLRTTSNTDMLPDDYGEWDDSTLDVDIDTLNKWIDEDFRNKRGQVLPDAMYEVYRDTWTNPKNMHAQMTGYQDLLNALDWLAENKTSYLNKLFNGGYDELDPNYITLSGGNRNPYVNIDYEVRHNRAVRFVVGRAESVGYNGRVK